MNSIQIELQENQGHFAARAIWGMSAWHRDPMTAISELFGKALVPAIKFANRVVEPYDQATKSAQLAEPSGPSETMTPL